MLVHGRLDYRRICKVVLYSFYKNIVLTLILFAFTFVSGFSGQSLFDDYIYSAYNIILALPVIAFGVFDRDISIEALETYNFLYVSGRERLDLNVSILLKVGESVHPIPCKPLNNQPTTRLRQSQVVASNIIYLHDD